MEALKPLRRIALMTQWTEFDSGAERAAIALAQKVKRPLSVVVPLFSNPEYEVIAPKLVADADAATAKAIADFTSRAWAAGVAIEIHVRRGDELWREVVEEASAERTDLIVTRRRGHRSFLGKLRVGEMVRQIAAHSHCPLMMVPRAAHAPARGILTLIESELAIEPQMRAACALADLLGLPLGVLIVIPAGQRPEQGAVLLQRAQVVAEQAHMKAEVSVQSGRLADVVGARLRTTPVDLLVVGIPPGPASHGKLGDTVETVVSEAPCATLLVGLRTSIAR